MKFDKVVDPKLIGMGLGVFGATFLSTQMVDMLGDQPTPFVREYAREITGALLTVGGTFLMGGRETKTVGLAVGAAGVSTIASGVVRRLQGKAPAAVRQNGNVNGNDNYRDWPIDEPLPDGTYLASMPHRGVFRLA